MNRCAVVLALGVISAVLTPGPMRAQNPAPMLVFSAQPDLTIGDLDGPNALSSAMWILPAADRLYVVEPSLNVIHTYDTSGRRLHQLGRPGEGPGEFRGMFFAGVLGDTVWVSDTRLRRVTMFGRTGETLGTLPFTRRYQEYRMPVVTAALQNGFFVAEPPASAAAAQLDGPRDSIPMLLLSRDGTMHRVLGWRKQGAVMMNIPATPRPVPIRLPVVAQEQFVASPDGSVVLRIDGTAADRYEITAFAPDGSLQWRKAYTVEPRAVSRQRRREMVEYTAERIASRFPSRVAAVSAVDEHVYVPEHFPAVSFALIGADRSIWLKIGDPGRNEWHVLDQNGGFRAGARLPDGFELKAITGNHVYGVVRDELDVPYVHRYRIVR